MNSNTEKSVKFLANFLMSEVLFYILKNISPFACSLKEKYLVLTPCFC